MLYEIKSASNNIDDAAQEIIRKKYKKSAPKAEEKPAAEKAEKPAAPKAEEKAKPEKTQPEKAADASGSETKAEEKKAADGEHDRPKKKSSITAVFNANPICIQMAGGKNDGENLEHFLGNRTKNSYGL